MAVEKEKVIARFRAGKFKIAPISNQRLDAIAAKLAQKLPEDTTDEAIDLELDDLNDLLPGGFMEVYKNEQRQDNEKKKLKQQSTESQQTNQQQQEQNQQQDDVPAWAKALLQEVQTLKAEKVQTSIQQKFTSLLNEVDPLFYKGRVPKSEDEVDALAAEIKTDYDAFLQKNVNSSLGNGKIARGNQSASKEASKEEIDAIVSTFNL